jgi:zona occludens toxin
VITLITGAPGAGKTNALVSLLAELAEGRALYVSGIPDLQVPHVVLDDPTKWHDVVEDGGAVVIDEVQRVWRPNRSKISDDIAALETHRHRGIDFFIVTQGPNLVHQNVRALVGRHVHLRDTGITGRWWYEWPECCDNVTSGWKQAPLKKNYSLDKKAQALYTSASKHVKPIRSFPKVLLLLVAVLVGIVGLGWRTYDRFAPRMAEAQTLGQPKPATAASAPTAAPAGPVVAASAPVVAPAASAPRMAGCIAMRKRCECIDTDGLVMTVELSRCELDAGRGGATIPYPMAPTSPALADYLKRTPDLHDHPQESPTTTAALSPRAK